MPFSKIDREIDRQINAMMGVESGDGAAAQWEDD